jgi:hypothetical protein
MSHARFLAFAALLGAPMAGACSCVTAGSHCEALRGTEMVFVGRVVEDSGEGLGTGPAKMVIEEVLHGLAKNIRELTVDTGAGTSCYMRLQKDESYLIYGSSVAGVSNRINRNWCSFSFGVAGNEMLLSALRQAEIKANARLVGKVQVMHEEFNVQGEGAAGVRVVATSGKTKLETLTNGNGEFEFWNVVPGQYQLAVQSTDFVEDKFRWPSEGTYVAPSSCGYQNLYVWSNGQFEGSVRSVEGKPIEGVPVQAFAINNRGSLDNSPLRENKTDSNGRYVISGLPPGEFVVGVNGEQYYDRLAWPPRFYPGTSDRDGAARLHLDRGQKQTGIDLQLLAPRASALLHIEAVFEDGSPAVDAGANVEDLSGIQRAFALGRENHKSVLDVPVYVGETYKVKSFLVNVKSAPIEVGAPIRMQIRTWGGLSDPIQVTAQDVRVRVVLHEEKK